MNSERNKKVGFKSSNSNFCTDSPDTMKLMSYSKVSKALYNKGFEYRKSTMVSYQNHRAYMVRVVGLEPTRLAAQEPKSCVSTNSTIPAYSFVPLIFTRRGIRGGAFRLTHYLKTGTPAFNEQNTIIYESPTR